MTAFLTLAMMAAGAGVWFIISQAFIVKHFCLYCMTVHLCGLAICTLAIFLLRAMPQAASYDHMRSFFAADDAAPLEVASTTSPLQPVIAAGIASVGLAALIGGQMLYAPASMEVVDIPVPVFEEPAVADQGPTAPLERPADEPGDQVAPAMNETAEIADVPATEAGEAEEVLEEPQPAVVEDVIPESSEPIASLGEPTAAELFEPTPEESTAAETAESPLPAVEETTPALSVDETAAGPDVVEPAGEPAVATDETEADDTAVAETAEESPALDPAVAEIAPATKGQSFEELFGEEPLQLQPVSQGQPQPVDPNVKQVASAVPADDSTAVPRVFRFKYFRARYRRGGKPGLR